MDSIAVIIDKERITQFHNEINENYYNPENKYNEIFGLMIQLEGYLARCNFDPSILDESNVDKLTICIQLRDCFEIGAKIALRIGEEAKFDAWINLLMMIYCNYDGLLSVSVEKEKMYSLYLYKLLSNNDFDNFNCTIEKIPILFKNNKSVNLIPITIYNCLMSFDYRMIYQILNMLKEDIDTVHMVPSLFAMVRYHHAKIIESSCINVSVENIKQFLRFNTLDEAIQFIYAQNNWELNGDLISFKEMITTSKPPVEYTIQGDSNCRVCLHLNKPYSFCDQCDKPTDGSGYASNIIKMDVPIDYPVDIVKSVEDFRSFINLFDSLL